jgi:hypothetical protein
MKKSLLTVFLIGIAAYAHAQCTTPGKYDKAAYDDFSGANSPAGPSTGGFYEFGEATLGGDGNPNFQAVLTRDVANGELDVDLTTGYGEFVGFGIRFGDTNNDGSGTPYTIDLTSDASYLITIRNNTVDLTANADTFNFGLSIVDINGEIINTDTEYNTGGEIFNDAYKYTINVAVGPGETKTLTAGTVNSGYGPALSGSFAGGCYADYGTNTYVTTFDWTKVIGINFTVVNSNSNINDGYKPYALTNTSFSILDVRVGNDCSVATGLLSGRVHGDAISVMPNPASDNVKIIYTTQQGAVSVNVNDVMGNIVKTLEGTSSSAEINVGDLNKGVYFVSIQSDGKPVSSHQKLVVE